MSEVKWTKKTVWIDRKGEPIEEGLRANWYNEENEIICEIVVKKSPFVAATEVIDGIQIATLIDCVEATIEENGNFVQKIIPTSEIEII